MIKTSGHKWSKKGKFIIPVRAGNSWPDTVWDELALGAPFLAKESTVYYIFYTGEQLRPADSTRWTSEDYHCGIGVAETSGGDDVDDSYAKSANNPLLQPWHDPKYWMGYNIRGGSILKDPAVGQATDKLNLQDDFTVELLVNVTAAVTDASSGARIISKSELEIESYSGSCNIDVNDAGDPGHGTITAVVGTPFTIFAANEHIVLTDSAEGNDATYKISAIENAGAGAGSRIRITTVINGSDSLADTITVSGPPGVIKSTETFSVCFDTNGDPEVRIRLDDENIETLSLGVDPILGEPVYIAFSYDKGDDPNELKVFMSRQTNGAVVYDTKDIANNKDLHSTASGELSFLNRFDVAANYQSDKFSLMAVRIRSAAFANQAAFETAAAAVNSEGFDPGVSDTVLCMNFNGSGNVLIDESGNGYHGRIQLLENGTAAKIGGVTRVEADGMNGIQLNDSSGKACVYHIPDETWIMVLEGISGTAAGAGKAGRVGVAFSDNATPDDSWALFPIELIDDASSNSYTGSEDRKDGIYFPQISYSDSTFKLIYAKDTKEFGRIICYREATDLFLLQNATEQILFKSGRHAGESSGFDFNNLGSGSWENESLITPTASDIIAYSGTHLRFDKKGITREVKNIGIAQASAINGPYEKKGYVLPAGVVDYDYYGAENPFVYFTDGDDLFVIYMAREADPDETGDSAHNASIAIAELVSFDAHVLRDSDSVTVLELENDLGTLTVKKKLS